MAFPIFSLTVQTLKPSKRPIFRESVLRENGPHDFRSMTGGTDGPHLTGGRGTVPRRFERRPVTRLLRCTGSESADSAYTGSVRTGRRNGARPLSGSVHRLCARGFGLHRSGARLRPLERRRVGSAYADSVNQRVYIFGNGIMMMTSAPIILENLIECHFISEIFSQFNFGSYACSYLMHHCVVIILNMSKIE